MMRTLRHLPAAAMLAAAMLTAVAAAPAWAQDVPTPPAQHWSFDGPFGTFDLAAAQRGFQVYSEVCSTCHSMQYLHYRDLAGTFHHGGQVESPGYVPPRPPER